MRYVYLDQNKWIELSQAIYRTNAPESLQLAAKRLLDVVPQAAVFPLSSSHLIETTKNRNKRRRDRLLNVMLRFSGGHVIAPAYYLVPRQIHLAILNWKDSGHRDTRGPREAAVGVGIPFAFGMEGTFSERIGVTSEKAALMLDYLKTPAGLLDSLSWMMVEGNEPALNRWLQFEKRFAEDTEHMRKLLRNESKAVRRRVFAARLFYDLQSHIIQALLASGSTAEEFVQIGHRELTEFFTHVPSLDIQMELATERDEHKDRKVQPNDMIDIFALSVAIPYCDIVVTEKYWVDLASRKGLGKKYGTVLLTKIEDLPDYL